MKIDLRQTLANIRKLLKSQGATYIAIRNPDNIRYLTGFSMHGPEDGFVLITPSKLILFSDDRYAGTIKAIANKNDLIKFVIWDRLDPLGNVLKFIKKGLAVGFEAASEASSFDFVRRFKKAATERGVEVVETTDVIETVRMVKTPSEIAILKKASRISDQAFAFILGHIQPGKTEKEIAWELGAYLRKASECEELSFTTIVASGPNSAIPHATPSSRKLRKGDAITLDFGCILNDYHSDMTRTVFLGQPSPKLREIYGIVLEAQLAAAKQARIGMTGNEVDGFARKIITEAGYGKFFAHSTGHGVGVEIHELPRLTSSQLGKNILVENTVVTIEPGIYLPGKFGVRIEDTGIMTPAGFKPFCRSPKEPIVL